MKAGRRDSHREVSDDVLDVANHLLQNEFEICSAAPAQQARHFKLILKRIGGSSLRKEEKNGVTRSVFRLLGTNFGV